MEEKEVSLKEFIEENHILLSMVAVFATIIALINNLQIQWVSKSLSFIFIIGMVVVWHELYAQLPKKMSPKLLLFRYVLLWGLWGLVFYWFLEFRGVWHAFLVIPLFGMFFYLILYSLKPLINLKFMIKIFGFGQAKSKVQIFLRGVVIFLIGYLSLYAASLFSIPLNLILDMVKNSFK